MDLSDSERVQHTLTNAITKIDLSLQFLEQHTPLSGQQHQLVAAALNGITDLKLILQDDVDRHLIQLAAGDE